MVWPQSELGVTVELYLGPVLGWVDITEDVRLTSASSGGGILINRGRENEATQVEHSRCSLVLNNRHGKYSPRNPDSPYYGLIRRNTPIRVRVAESGTGTALAIPGRLYDDWTTDPKVRIYAANNSAFNLSGDLDVRVWGRMPNDWCFPASVFLAARWSDTGNNRAWYLRVRSSGNLALGWSPDGSVENRIFVDSTAPVVPGPRGELAVRATLDVNNGSGGWTVTFYQSTGDWPDANTTGMDGPWVQVGDPVTGTGVTSVASVTAEVEVGFMSRLLGSYSMVGEIYGFELRNGIDGPRLARPYFTNLPQGAASIVDADGRTWTWSPEIQVVDRSARFYGEVSSWPVKWDLSQEDRWVPLAAAGIMRRLGQGSPPALSPLARTYLRRGPAAFLPLEDPESAVAPTSKAEGIATGIAGLVTYGNIAGDLPGAASVAQLNSTSSYIRSEVAPRSSTLWSALVLFKLPTLPLVNDVTFFRLRMIGGKVAEWVWQCGTAGYRFTGYDSDGGVVTTQAWSWGGSVPTTWTAMSVQWQQVGSNVSWGVVWHQVGGTWYAGFDSWTYAGVLGRPVMAEVVGNVNFADAQVSMLVVDTKTIPLYTKEFAISAGGYTGETAGQRMWRLAKEEGIPFIFDGHPAYTEPLGPQPVGTFMEVMRAAAEVDGGVLYEPRGLLGLAYRPRTTLYNQKPADVSYPGQQVSELTPVDDDAETRNDITVERIGGGSVRAIQKTGPLSVNPPPLGVGTVDTSFRLNLYTDAQLPDHAGFRLRLGTVDQFRFPYIGSNLASRGWTPEKLRLVAQLDIGDGMSVSGLPVWLPEGVIKTIIQGYQEEIDAFDWKLGWNATSAVPWEVAVEGGLFRAGADGSTLGATITADAMSFHVVSTPANGPWTTDPTHFPFEVRVGTERWLIGSIGLPRDSFVRLETAGWGTDTSGQTWTTVGGSPTDFSILGG